MPGTQEVLTNGVVTIRTASWFPEQQEPAKELRSTQETLPGSHMAGFMEEGAFSGLGTVGRWARRRVSGGLDRPHSSAHSFMHARL